MKKGVGRVAGLKGDFSFGVVEDASSLLFCLACGFPFGDLASAQMLYGLGKSVRLYVVRRVEVPFKPCNIAALASQGDRVFPHFVPVQDFSFGVNSM